MINSNQINIIRLISQIKYRHSFALALALHVLLLHCQIGDKAVQQRCLSTHKKCQIFALVLFQLLAMVLQRYGNAVAHQAKIALILLLLLLLFLLVLLPQFVVSSLADRRLPIEFNLIGAGKQSLKVRAPNVVRHHPLPPPLLISLQAPTDTLPCLFPPPPPLLGGLKHAPALLLRLVCHKSSNTTS